MGNCISSNNDGHSSFHSFREKFTALRKKEIVVDEETRKPGIVSAEAVQWFVERDIKTLAQSISFVPWVIQRGIKIGTVTESTDSVCS